MKTQLTRSMARHSWSAMAIVFSMTVLGGISAASAQTLDLSGDNGYGPVNIQDHDLYDATDGFVRVGGPNNARTGWHVRKSPNVSFWINGFVFFAKNDGSIGDSNHLSWRDYKDWGQAGLIVSESRDFTIEGIRIDHAHDGIRTRAGSLRPHIDRVWISDARDDAYDNSHRDAVTARITRSLFEDVHTFVATKRGGSATGTPPAVRIEVIDTLISQGPHFDDREKRKYAWNDTDFGHGQTFKTDDRGAHDTILLQNNIFKLIQLPKQTKANHRVIKEEATIDPASGNNIFVWLGPQTSGGNGGIPVVNVDGVMVPESLGLHEPDLQAIFTVTDNPQVWNNARAAWMTNVWEGNGNEPPSKATGPTPPNGATGVSQTPTLSWTAGTGAASHDVYFGTNSTPGAGQFQGNQAGTTFNPGTLNASTTYFWRIDEVNSNGVTTGDVWSFTTAAAGGGGGTGEIAFVAASSATTGSSTAPSLTVNKPSGVSEGDFMIAGISVSNQDATITAPSGWTLVRTITDTMRLSIYSKMAGASEPSNYTWNSSINRRLAGGIVAFSGVDATTPIQAENGTDESGSSTNTHSTPTINVSGSDAWLVSIFADRTDGGSTWTPPSGTTERVDVHTTQNNNDPSLAINTVGPVSSGNHSHTATASKSSPRAAMQIIALNAGEGAGDTTPPTVSLTSPAQGTHVAGTILVTANASDDVGVVGVQFKLDGANLGAEDTTAPYSVNWNSTTATDGSHTLTAVARDAANNTTESSPVNVTVDNTPPTVSITSPSNNATVSGTISVTANASDNEGVVGVRFMLEVDGEDNGIQLGDEDMTAPYSVNWDTTTAPEGDGNYVLTAVARDLAGNTTTSSAVNVTVDNGINGAIAFVAASSAHTGSSTAPSVTVNRPSGVSQGDFMIAGISVSNQDATITAPSGWTLVRTITDTMRLSIYTKTAGASEPSNYTWNSSINRRLCAGIVAFSGVNASAPIQVEDGTDESGSSTNTHSTPTINVSGSDAWLVSIFADRTDGGSTWTPPSGTTERVDVHTTQNNNDPSLAINTVGPVSSGNHSHTATASKSSPRAAMQIIAIQP